MRPHIVLFGDSITEQSFRYGGWGASLTDTYSRKADIVVRGYGGYNTRWALFLLHHIFPLGSTTPPVAATIFFGANDAALAGRTSERQYVPLEEYKENLRKIVRHLKECSPTMLIVLITPPPIDEEGRKEYATDGLHLTPDGNGVVFEEVVRAFKGAWLSATEMPSDFPHHSEIDPQSPQTVFHQRCL
ncbi:Lipase, GDSL [Cynara cardunculus var. scolymus]|uniref:Lipase, GDSL n=1 Tax=Cynara cardunculus var. scolymus TaxID=59895 RepID=A0A103XWL8_CYNCS|nr:Lipase, GDSL [Cynara cardunculus var. scolymus]